MNLLTVRQAAQSVGVSPSLVYEWCNKGLLPHYRFGTKGKRGKVMIDEQELRALIASCRREAAPAPAALPLKHIKLHERHG